MSYSYMPPHGSPLYSSRSQSPPQHTGPLSLFDADQQHPHPNLMQNFITVLFDQMAAEFTFFTYHEVMNNFLERRITPILSNSIAAFAAQCVNFFPCSPTSDLPPSGILHCLSSRSAAYTTLRTPTQTMPRYIISLWLVWKIIAAKFLI